MTSCFQYSIAVAARTVDESLGRLSQKVTVRVKPEDVPMNLRGEGVTTHTMRLTWGTPIRYKQNKHGAPPSGRAKPNIGHPHQVEPNQTWGTTIR